MRTLPVAPRSPIVEISGSQVALMGDPHLGRRFVTGVPLHRRGEREASVMADFTASLQGVEGCVAHVCLGDLFDRSVVPFNVILATADAYRTAAADHPGVRYFILKGNHDDTRDADFRSALDVLDRLLEPVPNVHIISDAAHVARIETADQPLTLGFFPWHPFKRASALVTDDLPELDAAFGHWDTDDFGQDIHNLLPVEALGELTEQVWTGHIHRPDDRRIGDLAVHVVGALQPYAHGEDPDERLYVTCTLEALYRRLSEEPESLEMQCVRLLLPPGAAPPEGIDCLQLTVKRVDEEGSLIDADDLTVDFESFDLDTLFDEAFEAHGVPADITEQVRLKFDTLKAELTDGSGR